MKELKIGNLLAKVPIVQGGMGVGISLSGLASAVANAGGIGVISSAGLGVIYNEFSKDFNQACIYGLKEELRKAKEKTKGIIGVNIIKWSQLKIRQVVQHRFFKIKRKGHQIKTQIKSQT